MLDKEVFANSMAGLAEIFDSNISENILDIYYDIFKGYSSEIFSKAINLCVIRHKYNTLPKPANIIDCINEVTLSIQDKSRNGDNPNQDWEEISDEGRKKISEIVKETMDKIEEKNESS